MNKGLIDASLILRCKDDTQPRVHLRIRRGSLMRRHVQRAHGCDLSCRKVLQPDPFHDRIEYWVGRCLVQDHLVIRPVAVLKELGQHRKPGDAWLHPSSSQSDTRDLPKDQRGARVESPPEQQKVGRFEALASPDPRVDTEVSEQTVLGRDAGEHTRLEALLASSLDRLVRWSDEHPRVPVEHRAYDEPSTNP